MFVLRVVVLALVAAWPALAAAAGLPLAEAAARGDLSAVRSLIASGADINAAQVDGTTALHAAVEADRLDIAEVLLRAGATATRGDRYGVTPLYLAVAVLLKAGAAVARWSVWPGSKCLRELREIGRAAALRGFRQLAVGLCSMLSTTSTSSGAWRGSSVSPAF